MTKVIDIPYNEELRNAIWPAFKVEIEDKHGYGGTEGARGEANALKLLIENFNYNTIINHAKDVWSQLFGIDFTCFNNRKDHITVDAKSGRSSLYWDKENKYWYITIRPEFFDPEKNNSHVMHVGPKGDLFVMYEKRKMEEYMFTCKRLIQDNYGKRLRLQDFPDFVEHNIKGW